MGNTFRRRGSPREGSVVKNVLRVLKSDRAFEYCSSVQEGSRPVVVPIIYDSFNFHAWKAGESAMLEAERKKAKAIMEIQKRRIF